MSRLVIACACLAACGSSVSVDRATLGSLEYAVPSGWSSRDLSTRERAMVEWRPADNEHHESITVVRSERAALAKKPARIRKLLEEAQHGLSNATFTIPTPITTKSGLRGFRVDGAFTPYGKTEVHQRIHAVLVDDKSLVHVVYTGREVDRETFETVVDSFFNRGA
jgi:hypothetical protein